jgi:hypothetical protein
MNLPSFIATRLGDRKFFINGDDLAAVQNDVGVLLRGGSALRCAEQDEGGDYRNRDLPKHGVYAIMSSSSILRDGRRETPNNLVKGMEE